MNLKHNKEEVIKKGLRLFCTNGFGAVGVDVICKTTGMTKGAFYNAFRSKENFLLACLEFYSKQNVARITQKLAADGQKSAFERLDFFYTEMLLMQTKSDYMGCMVNNMMSELGANNSLVAKATNLYFEDFLDAIEPAIKEAQNAHELTSEIESREMANLIHATFFGILNRIKSSHNPEQSIRTIQLLLHNLKP